MQDAFQERAERIAADAESARARAAREAAAILAGLFTPNRKDA